MSYGSKGVYDPGIAKLVRQERSAPTPDDILWARLHVEIFEKLCDVTPAEQNEARTACYVAAKKAYPQLTDRCNVELEGVCYARYAEARKER